MEQVPPQQLCDLQFSIPGKVFILGEYAVLSQLPAVVAAIQPRFQAVRSPSSLFCFKDPHLGRGGFGASTAEFALNTYSIKKVENQDFKLDELWRLYRKENSSNCSLGPSGADLIAQCMGGVVIFDFVVEQAKFSVRNIWEDFDWSHFLVFSATSQRGRKTPTYEHLRTLKVTDFSFLKENLFRGIEAIERGDFLELAHAMSNYADQLFELGLENPLTREDRRALKKQPGVLGVKGVGAFQSDAILILMEPHSPHKSQVIKAAKRRALELVSMGIPFERGIQEEIH